MLHVNLYDSMQDTHTDTDQTERERQSDGESDRERSLNPKPITAKRHMSTISPATCDKGRYDRNRSWRFAGFQIQNQSKCRLLKSISESDSLDFSRSALVCKAFFCDARHCSIDLAGL